MKMHLKMLSAKWRPFCLGLNVLMLNNMRLNSVQQIPSNNKLTSLLSAEVHLYNFLWTHLSSMSSSHFRCRSPWSQDSGNADRPSLQPNNAPATAPLVSASPACKEEGRGQGKVWGSYRRLWWKPSRVLVMDPPMSTIAVTPFIAWISNHKPSKVWDEITYPFLNFNGCTVEV